MSLLPHRLFAVIPAAGQSRRMGRPKLLLPFDGTTVIGRLIGTLGDVVTATYVLVRPDDEALGDEAGRLGAQVVLPGEPPSEMRDSVEHLLRTIEEDHHPRPDDGWLLIPADHPLLTLTTLRELIANWREHPASVVLPTHEGRRGHPTLFPWSLAAAVFDLPENVGINYLLQTHHEAVREVPVNDSTVTLDLDTPADYERALTVL